MAHAIRARLGDTLMLRNSKNGLEKAGTVIAIDHREGTIDVENNESITIYDSQFLWEGGHKAQGQEIYDFPYNIVGSNWRKGINYPNADGSYNKGIDSQAHEKLTRNTPSSSLLSDAPSVSKSKRSGVIISPEYRSPDARPGDPPSGPSRPGHESFESSRDRGAFSGSRASWESYSQAARVAERDYGGKSSSGSKSGSSKK